MPTTTTDDTTAPQTEHPSGLLRLAIGIAVQAARDAARGDEAARAFLKHSDFAATLCEVLEQSPMPFAITCNLWSGIHRIANHRSQPNA